MALWYEKALDVLKESLNNDPIIEGFDFLQDFYLEDGNDYYLDQDYDSAEEFAEKNLNNFQEYITNNGVCISDTGRWSASGDSDIALGENRVSQSGPDVSEYSDLLKAPIYELNDEYYAKIEKLVYKLRSLKDERVLSASMKLAEAATMSGKGDEKIRQIWADCVEYSKEYQDPSSLVACLDKVAYYNIKLSKNFESASNYREAAESESDPVKKIDFLRMARIQYQIVGDHESASEVFVEKMKLKSGGGVFRNKTLKILKYTSEYGESPKVVWINIFLWIAILSVVLTPFMECDFDINKSSIQFVDALYYVMVTFTTLGYGDITPNIWYWKILSGFISFLGLIYTSLLMVTIVRKYSRS